MKAAIGLLDAPLALIDPQEPLLKPETLGSRGCPEVRNFGKEGNRQGYPQGLEAINGGPNSWKPFR